MEALQTYKLKEIEFYPPESIFSPKIEDLGKEIHKNFWNVFCSPFIFIFEVFFIIEVIFSLR